MERDNADFLAQLPPFLDGRSVNLQNMVSIPIKKLFGYRSCRSFYVTVQCKCWRYVTEWTIGLTYFRRRQIFDYMNVQFTHNTTFASNLPDGFLERARHLANYHEYGVFTSPQLDGIGNSKHFCLVSWRFCYSEHI